MNVDAIKAAYRRALGEFEVIQIRRYTGTGPNRPMFEVDVMARVTGFEPQEMFAGIQQADRKAIIFHDDLVEKGFPVPINNQDEAVWQGKPMKIRVPDNATRRAGGVTIAYELQIIG